MAFPSPTSMGGSSMASLLVFLAVVTVAGGGGVGGLSLLAAVGVEVVDKSGLRGGVGSTSLVASTAAGFLLSSSEITLSLLLLELVVSVLSASSVSESSFCCAVVVGVRSFLSELSMSAGVSSCTLSSLGK